MTRDELAAAGAKLSGGPIKGFEGGWAMIPFTLSKVHFFREDADAIPTIYKGERVKFWRALCGVEAQTYKGVPALGGGAFSRCERCRKALIKITPKVTT